MTHEGPTTSSIYFPIHEYLLTTTRRATVIIHPLSSFPISRSLGRQLRHFLIPRVATFLVLTPLPRHHHHHFLLLQPSYSYSKAHRGVVAFTTTILIIYLLCSKTRSQHTNRLSFSFTPRLAPTLHLTTGPIYTPLLPLSLSFI